MTTWNTEDEIWFVSFTFADATGPTGGEGMCGTFTYWAAQRFAATCPGVVTIYQ